MRNRSWVIGKTLFLPGFAIALILAISASSNASEFGLVNSQLADEFRQEASRIIENASALGKPKSVGPKKPDEFKLLQDAYEANPQATLDLIERILKAGLDEQ